MPRLKQEVAVTTETTVELSPKLKKKVQVALGLYSDLVRQKKEIETRIAAAKEAVESPFHDAGETDALHVGVKVNDITVKWITGKTTKSLNKVKLMKKYKLTPADLASVTDEKPKADYLGVYLPGDKPREEE